MCMTFGYNPLINFCHFFQSLNLVIFVLNYYRTFWQFELSRLVRTYYNTRFIRIMLLKIEFVVCKWYPVHLLYTQCLIAGEIKTIGGGIRVPWTLFLVCALLGQDIR